MEIYEVLKIMSSESKAKIISKFLFCSNCHQQNVNNLCSETGFKQANLSKHLMELRQKGVIRDEKIGREVIYKINKNFEKEWGDFIQTIIDKDKSLKSIHCGCGK